MGYASRTTREHKTPESNKSVNGYALQHIFAPLLLRPPLLVNALLLLFLSDTYGGRVHEKPMADATPSPLPVGSRLLPALGFLAFTLPDVEILMPTKKPRGQEWTWEQQRANQALHCRGSGSSMSTAA
jgi:hypothetical protein